MNKRKSIGPLYAMYPARAINHWMGDKAFKVIASIISVLLWWGVYYVLLGVVNFNKNTFLEGSTETTVNELFTSDTSMIVLGISSVIVCVYVFRTRVGDRQTRKKRR